MSNAATKAKAKWNSANYTQVKVQVRPEVAASFKTACANAGISMASELSRFMAEYSSVAPNHTPNQKTGKKLAEMGSVSTKKKRSKTIRGLIDKLELVRDAEEQAMENTPENFRGSESFEASEERISSMDEALDILGELY